MITHRMHLWHGFGAAFLATAFAAYKGAALGGEVRAVDLLALFASGAIAGAGLTGALARIRAPRAPAPPSS